MVTTDSVQKFWEENPLCKKDIAEPYGSLEFLRAFDALRETVEPKEFSQQFYQFSSFQNKDVLDVGCGNGWLISQYAHAGARAHAIDITQSAVDLTKRRLEQLHLTGDIKVGDAEHLPFPDQSFDLVTSMGVLHHTPNTAAAVKEIWRVLRPGGEFKIMLYHRNSVLYRFKFPILKVLTGKSMQQLVNEVDGPNNPKGDVYSKEEMTALLKDFRVEEIFCRSLQGFMVMPFVGKFLKDAWFKRFESKGGWFLYAVARKPV